MRSRYLRPDGCFQLHAVALLLALAGCPHRTAPVDPGAAQREALARDIAALIIPPGDDTWPALTRLGERGDDGDVTAAWERAHYLLDLFDDARFRRDPTSLVLLARAGDFAAEHGAAATDQALAFLDAELNRVSRLDRLHAGAQAARTLVQFDRDPPTRRDQVFQRIGEVKAVARGPILAGNAELRLYGYCRNAFTDAVRAPWSLRMRVLAHCLYPLYDSDPEPYFADDPALRPPPPRWRVLRDDLDRLIGRVADRGDRLAPAARHQRQALAEFLADNQDRLPELPDPSAIGAIQVAHATPYDWSPLLQLGDGSALPPLAQDIDRLAKPVQGDGRGAVAVALTADAPLAALAHAVEVATGAGAVRVELLVAIDQKLVVPPGDYWSGRLHGDHVLRLATIPVMVAAAPPAPEVLANLHPHVQSWDPDRARLGLHLEITDRKWRLVAPTGTVAELDVGGAGDLATRLRAVLARVRAAFSGESGLVLVPTPSVTYGAVVSAAAAAATDADGRALFPMLGFAATVPRPDSESLARRIERRAGARVAIDPAVLDSRATLVRNCYQELLEHKPELGGEVRVELRGNAAAVVAGPRDAELRRCVVRGVGAAMAAAGVASAAVTLSPK